MNEEALDAAMLTIDASIRELVKRGVRAYMSNLPEEGMLQNSILRVREYSLDYVAGKFYKNGEEIHLTAKQFKAAQFFMENKGQLVPMREIMLGIWGPGYATPDQYQYWRVMVSELRRKTADKNFVVAIIGQGYRMDA